MSDTAQGPGWWQASDGKFYPPQNMPSPPGAPPAPPQQKKKGGCLKFGLIALAVLVVLGVLAAALGGGGDDAETAVDAGSPTDSTVSPAGEAEAAEAPVTTAKPAAAGKCGRTYPDKQPKDQCPGDTVQLSGFTVTVTSPQRARNDTFGGRICVDVALENRDPKSQAYSEFDFKLQFPSGDVQDPTIHTQEPKLESGTLVNGGKKSGKVCFEDNGESGESIVIWKPDAFNAERALWFFNL